MRAATDNYYALLEIEPTASAVEVRKAYFRLAKIYHPDRQVEHSDANTEIFLAVQEAYDVLSDAKRRLDYDESLHSAAHHQTPDSTGPVSGPQSGAPASEKTPSKPVATRRGPTIEEEKDARMGFMKAETLLEQGNHEQAARVMRAVVRTVPENPEYLSLAGYL